MFGSFDRVLVIAEVNMEYVDGSVLDIVLLGNVELSF